MLKQILSFITYLTILLVTITSIAFTQTLLGKFERTYSVGERPELKVETRSGDIIVKGDNDNEIHIIGEIRAKHSGWIDRSSRMSEAQQIEENPPISVHGDIIEIEQISRGLGKILFIDYKISVPERTELMASAGSGDISLETLSRYVQASVGSGDINVNSIKDGALLSSGSGDITGEKLDGDFEASTGSGDIMLDFSNKGDVEVSVGSGDIRLNNVEGSLNVTTGSGDVHVLGKPLRDWEIRTASGDIDFELKGKLGFDLLAKTSSGDINTEYPITIIGKINRRKLEGKIRGGGKKLYLSTASGDINIY